MGLVLHDWRPAAACQPRGLQYLHTVMLAQPRPTMWNFHSHAWGWVGCLLRLGLAYACDTPKIPTIAKSKMSTEKKGTIIFGNRGVDKEDRQDFSSQRNCLVSGSYHALLQTGLWWVRSRGNRRDRQARLTVTIAWRSVDMVECD